MIHCFENGLRESELRDLLVRKNISSADTDVSGINGDDKDENCLQDNATLPMMTWARIRRKIKMFLMNTGAGDEEASYSFMHNSIHEVNQPGI